MDAVLRTGERFGLKTNGEPWFRRAGSCPRGIFCGFRPLADSTLLFLICSYHLMTYRPASWRIPPPKQMEKLATEAARRPANAAGAPEVPLPPEYWDSLLQNPQAASSGLRTRHRRLAAIR